MSKPRVYILKECGEITIFSTARKVIERTKKQYREIALIEYYGDKVAGLAPQGDYGDYTIRLVDVGTEKLIAHLNKKGFLIVTLEGYETIDLERNWLQ